jgi:hypothetical protein
MACTKETYTAVNTWTASQLANLFRDAFIDAGLMADWYDSFLSGSVENRILEVTYDGTKTYGKTYYWFMFTTSGVFLHVATGWNASTDVPTGTQYLDFFATTTNSTSNHWTMLSASSSSTIELVRYTSGNDLNQSWFVLKNSGTRRCFTVVNGAKDTQPYLDMDKGFFCGFCHTRPSCLLFSGALTFTRGPGLRRDLIIGSSLKGSSTNSDYSSSSASIPTLVYGAPGNASSNNNSNIITSFSADGNYTQQQGARAGAIILPVAFSDTNPAFTSNSNPVFHSMPFMPYITDSLPSDFGLTFHYATNTFSPGDTFVVSAGVEEWEVLDFAANSSAVTGASPLFLARMI